MSEKKYRDYIYSGVLSKQIAAYIAEKRAAGCIYNTEAKRLSEFSRFSMGFEIQENSLPENVVKAWLERRPNDADKTVYYRFSIIKGFADYIRRTGGNAYIPSNGDIPKLSFNKYVPHIFTYEEITRFFNVYADKREFRTAYAVRFHVMMELIFKTLYCCGLRMSEVTNLKREDIDLENGILTIRFAKFEKFRYVPMSEELTSDYKYYLNHYLHEPFVFPSSKGIRLNKNSVYEEFRKTLCLAGIPHSGRGKGPRVHDFRHTFAVHCLHRWTQLGVPLSSVLPRLSTYLGHNDMTATERYLRMTAEIYPEISDKLSSCFGHIIPMEV